MTIAFKGPGIGTSGVFAVPSPSPSLDPGALGTVDEKDRVRQHAVAALGHAQVIGKAMCEAARGAHGDESLSLVDKHRAAHERSARAALPLIGTIEKALAIYTKEIGTLGKKYQEESLRHRRSEWRPKSRTGGEERRGRRGAFRQRSGA
jgi:hypothetical protein